MNKNIWIVWICLASPPSAASLPVDVARFPNADSLNPYAPFGTFKLLASIERADCLRYPRTAGRAGAHSARRPAPSAPR